MAYETDNLYSTILAARQANVPMKDIVQQFTDAVNKIEKQEQEDAAKVSEQQRRNDFIIKLYSIVHKDLNAPINEKTAAFYTCTLYDRDVASQDPTQVESLAYYRSVYDIVSHILGDKTWADLVVSSGKWMESVFKIANSSQATRSQKQERKSDRAEEVKHINNTNCGNGDRARIRDFANRGTR